MGKRKAIPTPLRDKLLVEAMHRCCLCPEHHDLTDMHHIIPISRRGPNTQKNLMVVCPTCHGKIHRIRGRYTVKQLRMYKERWVELCALGLPLDVRLAQAFNHTRQPAPPRVPVGMPSPPQAYFAHPYPMQENFTGRLRERKMLTGWLMEDDRPVLPFVGLGGTGKSALTWAWVQRDVLGLPLPGATEEPPEVADACGVGAAGRPDGVLWYSFYERESTFENFVNAALTYASGGAIDPRKIPSLHAGMEVLYNLLCQNRFLVLLDGVERILRAYASLDAAYQGDVVTEDGRGDFRSCVDPKAGTFLQWLASGATKSKVVLTSRLFPGELDGLSGCRREEMTGFDLDDALIFFRRQGIDCTRAEVEDACAPYGYLPLAMRLLSGLVSEDPARPGDIRVATEYRITEDLRGKEQHHILERAYNALETQERELLSRIAAFRSRVEYDVLKTLFGPGEEKAQREKGFRYKTEKGLKEALKGLVKRGLLLRQEGTGRYDLHPIVRQYAYHRLGDKEGTHTRLRDYFSTVPTPERGKVEGVEDLLPVIELYHHTVGAGQYDEACYLYHDRLSDLLYFRLGAYLTCIELLRALFPDGEDRPPRLKKDGDQAWTLNALAISYGLSGQPRRAVALFDAHNEIQDRTGQRVRLAAGLGNLAGEQVKLGELVAVQRNLRRRIELSREAEDEFNEAIGHQEFGRLLAYEGAFDGASRELGTSTRYWKRTGHRHGVCLDESYRALRALLMGDAKAALDAARRARKLADISLPHYGKVERNIILAECLLGWSKVSLASRAERGRNAVLAEAEEHLRESLSRCRRINLVELEPDILLASARWHRAKGDIWQARKDAEGALTIADRCEYRLNQADIHNFLARLALDEGNKDDAKKHAETARERAWCDGPPHCYKPALDEAERLLEEIERLR